ncbi:sensor histidine kinase KdpD [Cyanobium sp. LEGE 06113]|uniref:sensor histidine kinase n=1 Tax=Cyanobium sp. LEGE 06113 TaxID=1297573 RepID=UPI00187FA173|nr:HAMP domain-containing histidine kinase [Cyanobium sp. LEGE 06113]MBE9153240.1 HAMP domain-containing histidine kinase [Cyanobium sp. LEGE 06113]
MVSLLKLRHCLTAGVPPGTSTDDAARRQWWAALATLQEDFLLPLGEVSGLWLAAPLPALYEPALLQRLQGWVWSPAAIGTLLPPAPPRLLQSATGQSRGAVPGSGYHRLLLEEGDGDDPLLVIVTPQLQVALCLDGPAEGRRLVVRFDPEVLSEALSLMHQRLEQSDPAAALELRTAVQQMGPLHSEPSLGLRFWPLLANRLARIAPSLTLQPLAAAAGGKPSQAQATASSAAQISELALLEALTHEVRTPLATIRTLIRSLLRRSDLPAVVRQRLEHIDGECSEQIDRFGLIFLAAELQRPLGQGQAQADLPLARTDLSELLGQLEGLWQRQLARRQLTLDLQITPDLPQVLSDPARLETMLGGLIDRFSRSLPAGTRVRLVLQPAGARLKLQLSSTGPVPVPGEPSPRGRELVGPVLSWDPSTGSLQLSRQATQQLFERLGGRLTERSGSGLTVFFPVYVPAA